MKTKLITITLAFIAIFSSCNDPIKEIEQEPVKFNFPDGWQNLTDHSEKIAALQIPEDIITRLSTEDLVEACMTYPLGPDCLFYNDYQFGLNNMVIKNFNGFAELKKHNDAFDKVLDYYSNYIDSIDKITDRKELTSLSFMLYYQEQFIISGYLFPVDQLKNLQKFINLFYKAVNLRAKHELVGSASINTLNAMKKILEIE